MKKSEIIECFIPAMALQHYANGEEYTQKDKIRAAVQRFYFNGNFEDLITVKYPMPHFFIKQTKFNPKKMGYFVVAEVY